VPLERIGCTTEVSVFKVKKPPFSTKVQLSSIVPGIPAESVYKLAVTGLMELLPAKTIPEGLPPLVVTNRIPTKALVSEYAITGGEGLA
jgi:hypothetical protein